MFEEELSTLKKFLKVVSPGNTRMREIKDRISKIEEFINPENHSIPI